MRASIKAWDVLYDPTRCRASPSQLKMPPKFASQILAAFSSMLVSTGSRSPGKPLMTRSTSDVAVSRSRASLSSRVRRVTSVSLPAVDELERATAFGALRRFRSGVLRRRPLTGSPPALERRFIASPVG